MMGNLTLYIIILAGLIGLPIAQMFNEVNHSVVNILYAIFIITLVLRVIQYVATLFFQVDAARGDARGYLEIMGKIDYRKTKIAATVISYIILAGCDYVWTAILLCGLHVILILMHYGISENVKLGKLKGIDTD